MLHPHLSQSLSRLPYLYRNPSPHSLILWSRVLNRRRNLQNQINLIQLQIQNRHRHQNLRQR